MDLYLLRHAKAERSAPDGSDASRPLSPKGRRDARRLGQWTRDHGLGLDLVATSPLVRAVETTNLVFEGAARLPPVEVWSELGPAQGTAGISSRLGGLDPGAAVLLVGHEPLLSTYLSETIGGGRVRLAKGALARIGGVGPGEDARLEWLVTPGLVTPAP